MLTSNELGRFNIVSTQDQPSPPQQVKPKLPTPRNEQAPKRRTSPALQLPRAELPVAILPCSSFALLLKVFLHSPRSYSSGHAGDGLWQCTEHSNPHLHWLFEQHSE